MTTIERFWQEFESHPSSPLRVLEVGTARSRLDEPTHLGDEMRTHRTDLDVTRIDIEGGEDVDVVADVQELPHTFGYGDGVFHACLLVSVLEHVAKPWIAESSIWHVLKKGGLVYVSTHQTYPIHKFPSDYFRFTIPALESLFSAQSWEHVASGYEYPCKVVPVDECPGFDDDHEAYMNVALLARKL